MGDTISVISFFLVPSSTSFFFNTAELTEMKRLLADMHTSPKEIADDEDILEVFAGQLTVRMNDGRQYRPDEIVTALKDLPD